MNQLLLLFLILVLAVFLPLLLKSNKLPFPLEEGFINYSLISQNDSLATPSSFPKTESEVLLQDAYPITGRNSISNETSSDMWWHYPIFKLGSYAQVTNNIRYPNNPDEGTCMPGSMCGALYREKHNKSNYVNPLPQLNPDCGRRVGYFDTPVNLMPYRTNMQNILY